MGAGLFQARGGTKSFRLGYTLGTWFSSKALGAHTVAHCLNQGRGRPFALRVSASHTDTLGEKEP